MSLQVGQLQHCLDRGCFLSVQADKGTVQVEEMSGARISKGALLPDAVKAKILQSGEALIDCTLEKMKNKPLRALPEAEREQIRDLVDFCAQYIKGLGKAFRKVDPVGVERMEAKVLSAKMGGKLNPEHLLDPKNKEFVDFVQANHLHNKMQALGRECWVVPTLGVEGMGDYLFWSLFSKVDRVDAAGKKIGYTFFYQGKPAFETDLKCKLTDDYCYINGKISKYNPIRSPEVRCYDTQPADGTFKVEIWTALHDVKGERPVVTIGDHSHLVLIDDKGQRFGVGQYGMADDLNCQHIFSAFGRKRGGIETPDRYLMLPKNSHSYQKVEVSVTKEQFDLLMKRVQADKCNPDLDVSLIKGNCTSYVRELLGTIGIKVETRMHPIELFFRKLAPMSWIHAFERIAEKTPSWVKKLVCFFPVFYVLLLLVGLLVLCLSRNSITKKSPDISLFDLLFRPWRVYTDHPFTLRKWQNKYLSQNKT